MDPISQGDEEQSSVSSRSLADVEDLAEEEIYEEAEYKQGKSGQGLTSA